MSGAGPISARRSESCLLWLELPRRRPIKPGDATHSHSRDRVHSASTGPSPSPLLRRRRRFTPLSGKAPGRPGARRPRASSFSGWKSPSATGLAPGEPPGAGSGALAPLDRAGAALTSRAPGVLAAQARAAAGLCPPAGGLLVLAARWVGGRGGSPCRVGAGDMAARARARSGPGAAARVRAVRPAGRGGVAAALERLRALPPRAAGSRGRGRRAPGRPAFFKRGGGGACPGCGEGAGAWLPAARRGAASNQRLPFMVITLPAELPLSPLWARTGAPWRLEAVARRKWAGRGRPHPTPDSGEALPAVRHG